jgi:hypothetical protein
VIQGRNISAILLAKELIGLLSEHVEFCVEESEKTAKIEPLPTNFADTWLNNRRERCLFPEVKLYTRNPVYTEDWRLLSPGYDVRSGIYYAGPAVGSVSGTPRLNALLQDFCFESQADRTNYIAMLLTGLLMPRFIGSKPAVLFNGNQPGLGKTILAQIVAILRDGHPTGTASYNPNDEEFEKRLAAIVRSGATTIIIDNAKSRGRHSRIDSPCLERSITDPILSFRLLGHSKEIRVENSHIFCITANAPDVSRDLVTRSVVVNLHHEGNPSRRTFLIANPEAYAEEHRLEILGELIGMVERWKAAGMPHAATHTRFNKCGWGDILGGILAECGEHGFLDNADDAALQLDETRREFAALVESLAGYPNPTWSATELVDQCRRHDLLVTDLGEGSPRSKATKMGTLASRYCNESFPLDDGRLVVFHGKDGRKGKAYRIEVHQMPNLEASAEPLPNLETPPGSAP